MSAPHPALQAAYVALVAGPWAFATLRNRNCAAARTALCRHLRARGWTNQDIAGMTGMTPNAVSISVHPDRPAWFTEPGASFAKAMKGEDPHIWERSPVGGLYRAGALARKRVVDRMRQDGLSIPDIAKLTRCRASTISDMIERIEAGVLAPAGSK